VTIKKQEVIVVSETLLARCESFPKFEQREYKEGELVDILDRWKTYYPKETSQLEKKGTLQREAEASAELTQLEMDALMLVGQTEAEAWQQARTLWILNNPLS
jgi:hypothetical protein